MNKLIQSRTEVQKVQENDQNKENINIFQFKQKQTSLILPRHFGQNISNSLPMNLINVPENKKMKTSQNSFINQQSLSTPQDIEDYQKNILIYANQQDSCFGFMNQEHINENMRCIMNGWLVGIHNKLKLQQETLFMAVHMIDRFLIERQIKKEDYQIVGVTALFISAKFQEIETPDINHFSYITKDSCRPENIINVESEILKAINFSIKPFNRLDFFQLNQALVKLNDTQKQFCEFILDLSLIDWRLKNFSEQTIAISTFYMYSELSSEFVNLQKLTKYDFASVQDCKNQLKSMFQQRNKKYFNEVCKKHNQFLIEHVLQ